MNPFPLDRVARFIKGQGFCANRKINFFGTASFSHHCSAVMDEAVIILDHKARVNPFCHTTHYVSGEGEIQKLGLDTELPDCMGNKAHVFCTHCIFKAYTSKLLSVHVTSKRLQASAFHRYPHHRA